ncbi:twitching motility protein PilT [Bacteroidia bacterium]|nr:twitching motility protein PilT [Bacteroidia bacterium]GHT81018.1 twitching motility protein PilT [Bacteroidia bacterium]
MEIIADANIFLAVILNEPEKGRIIELTKGAELVSPDVIPYEIGNALSAMQKRHRLDEVQVRRSFTIFEVIPVRLVSVDILQALNLACKFNIYAYDAYYLEVAQRLSLPLLTLDQQMKNTACELNIKLLDI